MRKFSLCRKKIDERLVKKKNDQMPTLVNNCVAFMLDEIRYELSDVEIDRNRNATITSMLKNYVSMTNDKTLIVLNARWNSRFRRKDTLIFACRSACCGLLRRLQTLDHQRSPRIDFEQRSQLLGEKSCDGV